MEILFGARLTVVSCALPFDADPPFLRDGLVHHPQDWNTIAQKGYQSAKHRFACMALQSVYQANANSNDLQGAEGPDCCLQVAV